MRKEIKVRMSEHTHETFYFYDKYDLRELPTPKSVEKIKPDCEDMNSNLDFFKLFDDDGDLIANVAVDINDFYDIDFKSYGSNFEAFLSEYDFFSKYFVATSSLNFVKSDYVGLTKLDAITDVEEKIVEKFGITEFDHNFIETFFDNLEN